MKMKQCKRRSCGKLVVAWADICPYCDGKRLDIVEVAGNDERTAEAGINQKEYEMKSEEDVKKLKESWLADPAWDIENTTGFEEHKAELLAFRKSKEREWENARLDEKYQRAKKIFNDTGVEDAPVASALSTWNEIENAVASQDRYIGEFSSTKDQVKVELMQAQVRATLLLAAQVKRIADALDTAKVY